MAAKKSGSRRLEGCGFDAWQVILKTAQCSGLNMMSHCGGHISHPSDWDNQCDLLWPLGVFCDIKSWHFLVLSPHFRIRPLECSKGWSRKWTPSSPTHRCHLGTLLSVHCISVIAFHGLTEKRCVKKHSPSFKTMRLTAFLQSLCKCWNSD